MSVIRDIFRRRVRSILTIAGIGVGIFALIVLGAVAENQNVYVDRLEGYYDDVIIVVEEEDANFVGMSSGRRPMSMAKMDELRAYPGVRAVSPQVSLILNDDYTSVIPPMALGVEPGSEDYEGFGLSKGRAMGPGDRGVALLGADIAQQLDAEITGSVDVRGVEFEVIGILERTYVNLLDSAAYIPLSDAQQIYHESLPEAFRPRVDPDDLVMMANVYVEPGEDTNQMAAAFNRDIEGILASSEDQMMETVDGLVSLVNSIVFSIAAIALLVSGLTIVNTMSVSVAERTREIGVKRALGASRGRVARDVVAESAVMGALGGIGGVLVGVSTALALNSVVIATTGTTALVVTPRLVIGALAFAVLLGAIGGLFPARYAARLDPAMALSHE